MVSANNYSANFGASQGLSCLLSNIGVWSENSAKRDSIEKPKEPQNSISCWEEYFDAHKGAQIIWTQTFGYIKL